MRLFVRSPRIVAGLGVAALLVAASCASSGAEEAGARFASQEIAMRLVASDAADDGTIRAALLLDLAPGWKTYWRDPGEAGLAPRIALSGSTNASPVAIGFPAPHRFGDEYGVSNGYSAPVALALTLRRLAPDAATTIRVSVALGVCETICIPVAADLVLPEGAGTAADDALVEAAFASLPRPATPEDGLNSATLSADGKVLSLAGRVGESGSVEGTDVFVAGPKGWSFGKPSRIARDGETLRVDIPVLGKPRKSGGEAIDIDALVTVGAGAVETTGIAVTQR